MKIQVDIDNKGEVPFEEIKRHIYSALRGFKINKVEEIKEEKKNGD